MYCEFRKHKVFSFRKKVDREINFLTSRKRENQRFSLKSTKTAKIAVFLMDTFENSENAVFHGFGQKQRKWRFSPFWAFWHIPHRGICIFHGFGALLAAFSAFGQTRFGLEAFDWPGQLHWPYCRILQILDPDLRPEIRLFAGFHFLQGQISESGLSAGLAGNSENAVFSLLSQNGGFGQNSGKRCFSHISDYRYIAKTSVFAVLAIIEENAIYRVFTLVNSQFASRRKLFPQIVIL